MNDNNTRELAALERLAQAEEQERQRVTATVSRVTSKLDTWKTALTEYETAHEVWVSDKSGDWAIHERYVDARDHIEGNAPDYLRTLLAVVGAARALEHEMWALELAGKIKPPLQEAINNFKDALKSLE